MKRSSKSIVQEKYPKAQSERQMGNDRKAYYLIRIGRNHDYFASGDTEAKAWKQAAEKIGRGQTK